MVASKQVKHCPVGFFSRAVEHRTDASWTASNSLDCMLVKDDGAVDSGEMVSPKAILLLVDNLSGFVTYQILTPIGSTAKVDKTRVL